MAEPNSYWLLIADSSMSPVFAVVEKFGLRERIAQIIQDKILRGGFRPGDRIVESAVAAQMQVGQNTVREALQILEHQGLVTKVPKVGTFVTRLTEEEVSQVYRVRVELESLAVELATERLDDDGLERLEDLAEQMTSFTRAGDIASFVRTDLDFHRAIWELSGNRFLEKALLSITQPLFAYLLIRYSASGPHHLEKVRECHWKIVEKMKAKDPATAREFAKQQMRDLWAETLKELKDSQGVVVADGLGRA